MKRAATLSASLAALSALPLHAEPAPALLGRVLGDADGHLRRVRDSFALAPAEAGQLGRNLSAVLGSGSGVRAVTFALILLIVGCGLEWLYWTAAAAPLRAVMVATAPSPRRAAVLAGRRLALAGFGLVVFGCSTLAAAVAVPWPPDVAWIAVTVTLVIVLVRAAWLLGSVSTAPHHPSLRPRILPAGRDRSTVAIGVWVAGLYHPAQSLHGADLPTREQVTRQVYAARDLRAGDAVEIHRKRVAVVHHSDSDVRLPIGEIDGLVRGQQLDLHLRMLRGERREVRHEQVGRQHLRQRHPQDPAQALIAPEDASLEFVRGSLHPLGKVQHLLASIRDAIAGGQPVEQHHAKSVFEFGQATEHGGVLDTEPLGARPKRSAARDREKVADIIPLDHGQL